MPAAACRGHELCQDQQLSTDSCTPPLLLPPPQAIDAVNQALLFTCEGLTADASTEITSGVAPTLLDSSVSAAQAFSLSSRPSATRKIYLDFDGHITEGTDWNNNKAISSIVTPAFDKDGNPSSWSADELSDIVAIWRAGKPRV